MTATSGLMTLRDAQLERVCRRVSSPLIPVTDTWGDQWWWRRFGTEPVDIHEYAGERVIDHSRHHWCVPLIGMLEMSAAMVAMGVVSFLMGFVPLTTWGLQLAMWVCVMGHNAWMARHLIRWRADVVIVTNWRLIRTGGILSSGVKSYRFDTVGNCFRYSSVWGRLFGFCDLRIIQNGGPHNQGADAEYFPRLPRSIARVIESRATRPAAPAQSDSASMYQAVRGWMGSN